MWLAVIAFLVIFSLVILAHELGHLYFARRAGVSVEEFGFGLPPRLWGTKRGDTIYSLNAIPFGGFVRLYGEGDEFLKDKKAFASKKPGAKFSIVIGGVLMNFLLGYLVLLIGFWVGMPPLVTPAEQYVSQPSRIVAQIIVGGVEDKSAAAAAGILPGDVILSVGQQTFAKPADFKSFILQNGLKPLLLNLKRSGEYISVKVTPALDSSGQAELGVLIDSNVEKVHYIWWQVPWLALQETARLLWLVVLSISNLIYRIFTTASLPAELSGPVGIAKITGDIVRLGWFKTLQFVVFLSLNLGIVNIVPFPGLDGGRLVFVVAEYLRRGKKIPGHIENTISTIGFFLLVLLIAVVTYKDIIKLI